MLNGDTITLLSKSPSLNGFLYENIIEPYFKTGLLVQSWGRPWMPPNCKPQSPYDSTNVQYIKIDEDDYWNGYNDHSKNGQFLINRV